MIVKRIDRWIIGFEKKHGINPEDALFRWVLRRPIRSGLIVLSIVSGAPFLFGLVTGFIAGALVF